MRTIWHEIWQIEPCTHIRDAILTRTQKPTWVSLIYHTEPATKKWKTEKLKSKKWICSEVSVNSLGNPCSQSWRRKGRLQWEGFAEKECFKPGMNDWGGDEILISINVSSINKNDKLEDIVITPEMILGKLQHLKLDKAAGNDNLSPRLLKSISSEIALPTAICNDLLEICRYWSCFTRLENGKYNAAI